MLLTSFLLIFLAEIADKTQFLMLALSQTYSFRSLFAGMSISACLLSLLSIAAAGWAPRLCAAVRDPHHGLSFVSALWLSFAEDAKQ